MAALLGQAVEWLTEPEVCGPQLGDPAALDRVCTRLITLLEADHGEYDTGWIDDLQPALRLQSVLHWYLLRDDPRVRELRPYFATVHDGRPLKADDAFPRRLLRAIDALGDQLFERARAWHVVSNETSRGLAWLLPAALVAAEEVHLIELGCSVGLNLYAEQRHYDLAWSSSKRLHLGQGHDNQFLTLCDGPLPGALEAFTDLERQGPRVLSRVGSSDKKLDLEQPETRELLEACVWGDQRRRLDRLREGIDIHTKARRLGIEPAKIYQLEIPRDLPEFLAAALPKNPRVPVIAYHTYVTAYMSDVEQRAVVREVREFARSWSLQHKLPWMWVRFEPSRSGRTAPYPGWCLWQVELFSGSRHKIIELGWAHPHLIRAQFGPGIEELRTLRNRR